MLTIQAAEPILLVVAASWPPVALASTTLKIWRTGETRGDKETGERAYAATLHSGQMTILIGLKSELDLV